MVNIYHLILILGYCKTHAIQSDRCLSDIDENSDEYKKKSLNDIIGELLSLQKNKI
jgi:hypothetical protein